MQNVFHALETAEDVEAALAQSASFLLSLLHAERLSVYRVALGQQELVLAYSTNPSLEANSLPLEPVAFASVAALDRKPVCVNNVLDPEALAAVRDGFSWDPGAGAEEGGAIQSVMAFPVEATDRLLGVLQIVNCTNPRSEHLFTEEDVRQGWRLARTLAAAMQAGRAREGTPFDNLVAKGMIDQAALDRLAEVSRRARISVGRLLIAQAGLPPSEVHGCLSEYYNTPFVPYDAGRQLDQALLDVLNRDFLKRRRWVPLAVSQAKDRATILIDDPLDEERVLEAQNVLGVQACEVRVGLTEDILAYINPPSMVEAAPEKPEKDRLDDLVGQLTRQGGPAAETKPEVAVAATELEDPDAPAIVRLVSRIIADAIAAGASDIHVEPNRGRDPGDIRVRVDGVCHRVLEVPADHMRQVVARIKVMSNLNIAEKRLPQDGKATVELDGKPYELRVATIPTVNGEGAVLRILTSARVITLDQLNLSAANEATLRELLTRPHGIFLVCGPTGSGKTTSLHAILNHINTPERKIWTAEDPVEITQKGLQQVQVNARINLTFATAIRAFLRGDPDVILIGEMRDYETAHTGIQASLTGHLVFSTLHTNSAPETITRLLDIGLDPLNFGDALIGVLAQRLVRTLCSKCKQPYSPDAEELERLRQAHGPDRFPELGLDGAALKLYRAVGCSACLNTGYKGRTGIHELLSATREVKAAVCRRSAASEIAQIACLQGMKTLRQDGIAKVLKGQTDFEQVRRVTVG